MLSCYQSTSQYVRTQEDKRRIKLILVIIQRAAGAEKKQKGKLIEGAKAGRS